MADPTPPRKTSLDRVAAAFLAPAQQPDEISRLGEYRILKVLGKGGMGMVFKADDPSLKRTVALKIMLPEIARRGTAKERFLREAQAYDAVPRRRRRREIGCGEVVERRIGAALSHLSRPAIEET